MKFVEKDFNGPPTELKKCAAAYDHKILSLDKKLREKCRRAIIPHLEKLYMGTCAYCESRVGSAATGQVEHYRPFSMYWWLVLEWTNLLFSCPLCNQKKGGRFPIKHENRRLTGPDYDNLRVDSKALTGEEPLLLNPELDDPGDHLVYISGGEDNREIRLQGISIKGKTTIDVCDLNRAALKENYKRQVEDIVNKIANKTEIMLLLMQKELIPIMDNPVEINVFVVYYQEDKAFRDELQIHLKILKRQGVINHWREREIPPGQQWEKETEREWDAPDFILLVVSPGLLDSGYLESSEVKTAVQLHRSFKTGLIPIILKECAWEKPPLYNLMPLPESGKPVISSHWQSMDEAFVNIDKALKRLIRRRKEKKASEKTGFQRAITSQAQNDEQYIERPAEKQIDQLLNDT